MSGQTELAALRVHKELLVLKSDTDRLLLVSELQRVGSAEYWLVEAGKAVRRHPLLTAAFGGGVGLLAIQTVRRPSGVVGWLGRLGRLGALGSAALSVWKLIPARKRRD
jgi:hypothetical protein